MSSSSLPLADDTCYRKTYITDGEIHFPCIVFFDPEVGQLVLVSRVDEYPIAVQALTFEQLLEYARDAINLFYSFCKGNPQLFSKYHGIIINRKTNRFGIFPQGPEKEKLSSVLVSVISAQTGVSL